MEIIETAVFTRQITALMDDDAYRSQQIELVLRPNAGNIIPGSGGLRKIRWRTSNHGKRGGSRIIYYWVTERNQILMLFAFAKNQRSDLTRVQLKILRRLMEESSDG